MLIGRFLAAITINAWLIVLGRMLYQLEDYIESAFDLFVEHDAEIKTLDVGTFELMFEKLSNYEDDQGHYIAKLKDEVITPLLDDQYSVFDKLAADIKSNTLNVDFYRTQFARIDEIKKHIGRTVMALAVPN